MVINSLNGLPVRPNVTHEQSITLENSDTNTKAVWESLKNQFEISEQMTIEENEGNKSSQGAPQSGTYKHIRKYLPQSYRKAFNFVKPRTKYALTDDTYHCAVQNKSKQDDVSTVRSSISWGKVIAYCLRNPLLAKKAGMIYETSIELQADDAYLYENGGWLYTDFDINSDLAGGERAVYAARIPALKDLESRQIFSAVQFRVGNEASNTNSAAYDELISEAIRYDDGFAKVVHANQPINQDLLKEDDNSNPPLKDIGIRLGWEDEQVAIWFNRQMQQTEEQTGMAVDAPLGVFGYRIDAREVGQEQWKSQNMVTNPNPVVLPLGNIEIVPTQTSLEPAVEVHPASHGNAKNDGFWIPVYYTGWIGKAITLADRDAEEIYMLNDTLKPIPTGNTDNAINNVPKKTAHAYLQDEQCNLPLIYNRDYEFRVRMMDVSGGGPTFEDVAYNGGDHPVETHHFKRYVAAGSMRLLNVDEFYSNATVPFEANTAYNPGILEHIVDKSNPVLRVKRPNLGYPAVVFTNKYKDAVAQLKSILQNASGRQAVDIGLPDPDVTSFIVRVEARTLEMDNAASLNGKEPYIKLYDKNFALPADNENGIFDQEFALKIVYRDFADVSLGKSFPQLYAEAADELLLPTARNLRITLIPVIGEAAGNAYADKSILEGKRTVLTAFRHSCTEANLFFKEEKITAIYLQPEQSIDRSNGKLAAGPKPRLLIKNSNTPVELSRLAEALNLTAHNMTLEDRKGCRTQFGCSKLMRHSLAPDNSSVSFSSLGELFQHWIVPIELRLNRDWSWNGMMPDSITIWRSWDSNSAEVVGTIGLSSIANINALHNADRKSTRMLFLDAFDPKIAVNDFPREITLSYFIQVNFKEGFDPAKIEELGSVVLPITIMPRQMPKLISAGIASSPYKADEEHYRFTEQRSRYLWFEMEEAIADPYTTYFARVVANAPDPLLCRVTEEMKITDIDDLPLAIDAEKIRIVQTGMHADYAGIGLMQEMIGETASGNGRKIYLMPLPTGLHANSDELFGFFSYEIRVGYNKEVRSTAQARYGRPLKINGVQHPAPGLTCTAIIKELYKPYANLELKELDSEEDKLLNAMLYKEVQQLKSNQVKPSEDPFEMGTEFLAKLAKAKNLRDKDKVVRELDEVIVKKIKSKKVVVIKAPYANAVRDGKNVTANPPQTSLWYLLYTQVKQADGKSYRNVLVDSAMLLPPRLQPSQQYYNKMDRSEGNVFGKAMVSLSDIKEKLIQMGLPASNSLSVLCVEMFPMHNHWQDKSKEGRMMVSESDNRYVPDMRFAESDEPIDNPLTSNLGQYRIYRTSPLVPLQDGCCDDC